MGSVTVLKYHLVLVTKYRRPLLKGIEQLVYRALCCVEEVSDFRINEFIKGDHEFRGVIKKSIFCHD